MTSYLCQLTKGLSTWPYEILLQGTELQTVYWTVQLGPRKEGMLTSER